MTRLPGFRAPVAEGHRGEVRSVALGEHRVLLYLGRTHLYEGHGPAAVAHPIRTAAAAGARLAVLTNANGSLRDDVELGAAGADPRPRQPRVRGARWRGRGSST